MPACRYNCFQKITVIPDCICFSCFYRIEKGVKHSKAMLHTRLPSWVTSPPRMSAKAAAMLAVFFVVLAVVPTALTAPNKDIGGQIADRSLKRVGRSVGVDAKDDGHGKVAIGLNSASPRLRRDVLEHREDPVLSLTVRCYSFYYDFLNRIIFNYLLNSTSTSAFYITIIVVNRRHWCIL